MLDLTPLVYTKWSRYCVSDLRQKITQLEQVVGSLTTENEALKTEVDRTKANAIAQRINAKRNYDQIMRAVEDIKDEGVKTYADFMDYRLWMNLPHVVGGNSGGNRESPNNSSSF
ncbi:hypothetical protein L484_012033 [Morus notabilis]|uniref:Uncharacterized protein n=1 Tax=Morus notabilis TaxID=981085 RepID=W9QZP5_9ROSA|nr:hypothetical protein L484_012033 [Morus notabilis]